MIYIPRRQQIDTNPTPNTLAARQLIFYQKYIGPRSICGTPGCGHTGDGDFVAVKNNAVGTHKGMDGLGVCTFRSCPCLAFTWVQYMRDFELKLNAVT